MRPMRTLATTRRVLRQLSHDHRSIAMLLIMPCLLLGLFAWLLNDSPGVFDRYGGPMLGVFPFILMFVVTSVTTLRERRSGTLERLLTTPLGKADFIVGYALAFGLLAILQAIITVGFTVFILEMKIDGSSWQLGLVTVLVAILGTALGLFASAFAKTEFQAVQFMPIIVFPQLLMGGLLIPREKMPETLQAISDWLPFSYAIDAANAAVAGDDDWTLWFPLLVIVGASMLSLVLASLTLRRRTA